MMSDCVREKYLDEYIADLNIDANVKKRMLDLHHREKNEHEQLNKCLHNCHKRIDELEQVIMELGTELGKAKRFIREHI